MDPLPDLSDEEVKEIALGIFRNEIWLDWPKDADDREFLMRWPIIAMSDPEQVPPNVAAVWEYMSKAAPRGVNGLPMFFSAHFLTINSAELILNMIKRLKDSINSI